MSKFIAAALCAFVVIVLIGTYATWRDCKDANGMPVRGLFGLECVKCIQPAKAPS